MKTAAVAISLILIVSACGNTQDDPSASTTQPDGPATSTTTVQTTTTALPATTSSTSVQVSTTTTAPDPTTTTSSSTTVPAPTTTTLAPPSTTVPSTAQVLIYLVGGPDADPNLLDCSEVWPVTRTVETPGVLKGAIGALLDDLTEEELAAGYDSWFHNEGWELSSVKIEDGVAYIDFAADVPFINNASTSCGSASFLAQLDQTATQFDGVERAIYSIGGNAETFYGWLQRDVPGA